MESGKISDYARLLRIIAHPTRLMILAELMKGTKCVNDIRDLLEVPQPNVSQHLAVLKKNGLVAARKDGVSRCYYLSKSGLVKGLFTTLKREHTGPAHHEMILPREDKRKVSRTPRGKRRVPERSRAE